MHAAEDTLATVLAQVEALAAEHGVSLVAVASSPCENVVSGKMKVSKVITTGPTADLASEITSLLQMLLADGHGPAVREALARVAPSAHLSLPRPATPAGAVAAEVAR